MIRSAEELARAEERAALEELLLRRQAESCRDQLTACLEVMQERLGLDPRAVLAIVAERVQRNLLQKKDATP